LLTSASELIPKLANARMSSGTRSLKKFHQVSCFSKMEKKENRSSCGEVKENHKTGQGKETFCRS
jgi:hypothetical protein